MKYLHMLARHGFQYGAQKEPKIDVPMGHRPTRQDLGILIVLLVLTIVLTVTIVAPILVAMLEAKDELGRVEKTQIGLHTRAINKPLIISVYYETMCRDSKKFITTQLHPLFLRLGGHENPFVDIEYFPYGKANTTKGPDGLFNFTCQHGPRECEGNRIHACALRHLPPANHSSFVACSMSSLDPPASGPSCAKLLGLDFTSAEECYAHEGPALLALLGLRTHALVPKLTYVPWVTYNEIWTLDDLNMSQTDLFAVVCRKLRDLVAVIPPQC